LVGREFLDGEALVEAINAILADIEKVPVVSQVDGETSRMY
jgi:hypothetical protein